MNIAKLLKHLLIDQFTLYGGGGKGGGSKPDAPNPYEVADATTAANKATAAYNKALNLNNYSNPFGSQTSEATSIDPSTGAAIWNTNTTASPELQNALSSLLGQTSNSGAANSYAQNGLSNINNQYNSLNQWLGGLSNNYAGYNSSLSSLGQQMDMNQVKQAQQQGQNAAYAAQTQYLDPQFSQQGESLDAKLANQGLTPGSEAYNNAMLNFNNQKQQAYSNAQNQSILTGSQIGAQNLQNQLSGINTQAGLIGQQSANNNAIAGLVGQFGQNLGAMAGGYGQMANIGQLPYQNLSSIAGLIPGYAGPAQSSTTPANIGQNIYSNYQAQLNNYNAAQQSQNQLLGGAFGLGSSALMGYMMSDRRVKKDIKLLGFLKNGLPWYSFQYVWGGEPEEGVMSDDVRRLIPSAVAVHVSGYDMVDYAQVA